MKPRRPPSTNPANAHNVSFWIDEPTMLALRQVADATGLRISGVLRVALREYVARQDANERLKREALERAGLGHLADLPTVRRAVGE